jgi:hypothetical protein
MLAGAASPQMGSSRHSQTNDSFQAPALAAYARLLQLLLRNDFNIRQSNQILASLVSLNQAQRGGTDRSGNGRAFLLAIFPELRLTST